MTWARWRNRTGLNAADNDERPKQDLPVEQARDRADLEAMRDIFTNRLRRRSDDYDATGELRLVIAKLQHTSDGTSVVSASS